MSSKKNTAEDQPVDADASSADVHPDQEAFDDEQEARQDVAFILVAYEDAFALEDHREAAVEFLERATEAFNAARDSHFRLDGEAWDRLNEDFPEIADYLMKTVERIREQEGPDAEGLPDVEEVFSLGFGFQDPEDVDLALLPVGRYYRLELDATDPPSHEGLPLAFWAHLGAEGAAEVRASAIEQRLMELLEHRQDLIEDALSAIVDEGMVWDLLAEAEGALMEDALFDFLKEHWPGAAEESAGTEQVAPEVVAEFSLEREDGYLYFIDKDGDVSRSRVAKDGEEKVDDEKVFECGIEREHGWLYYIGPTGNVVRVPMYAGHDIDD